MSITNESLKPKRAEGSAGKMQVIKGGRDSRPPSLLPTVRQSIARRVLLHGVSLARVAVEHKIGWQLAHDVVVEHLRMEYAAQVKKAFVAGRLSNSPNLPPALARRAA